MSRASRLFPQGELLVEVHVVLSGQEAPGLEFHERGGDQQELGGDIEIERLHPIEFGEVGIDDVRQIDLVQVDLLSQDQLQEQVERPVVDRGVDVDGHRQESVLGQITQL